MRWVGQIGCARRSAEKMQKTVIICIAVFAQLFSCCKHVPFPFSEGSGNRTIGLPTLESHWVPHPSLPHCGTLYCILEGNSTDLASAVGSGSGPNFVRVIPPIGDPRFVHTMAGVPWWTPSSLPAESFCIATLDYPAVSADARYEYEFVISAVGNQIYYEQRTIPLRTKTHVPKFKARSSVP